MATVTVDGAAVEPLANFEDAWGDWRGLGPASDNVFSTWEWAELWWRHFGGEGSLALSRVRVGGETVALLPLYRTRLAGLRIARLLGHGVADQLGPVCAREHCATALGALTRAHGARVLLAERLPSSAGDSPGAVILRAEASPTISISREGQWDDYLRARSPNFRQQVRRRERAMHRIGIRFRLVCEAAELPAALDALIALHRLRWGERSKAFAGRREGFHREFAAVALERGWLRLWLAEVDGHPVAAWYGFRFEGAEYFYQSGRDTSWDQHRLGAGLLEHTMREAFADGMREYRLLRGDEAYKQRYASETQTVDTVAFAQGPAGRVLLSSVRAAARAPSGRALLRAISGREA